ncbi:MAG: serine/threonine protein kinase [Proteobacteria bacterium]|nr:serine/threonine protein kinase [Pseudomonadota bacterium]
MKERHARALDEVFEAVIDLPPGQQSAQLDRLCEGRPEFRRQLEALLAADRRPDGILPRLPASASSEGAASAGKKPEIAATELATGPTREANTPSHAGDGCSPLGRMAGSYRIVEELARGGMGIVYVGLHEELERRAAVKILPASVARDPELVRRFKTEARAAAGLGHPGIVDVIDIGRLDRGDLYILMELLDGESVERRLRSGRRLPEATAVALVQQAVRALAAAHAQGIVHRDLKPANMFLVPDPEVPGGERVKLLDFGIAKLVEKPTEDMTRPGVVVGTPQYMAPEQCRSAADIDVRADLYAVGVILFRMLCGRLPFVKASPIEYLMAHLHDPAPRLLDLEPTASPEIAAIVQRLLMKEPEKRFASAETLLTALEQARTENRPADQKAGQPADSTPGPAPHPSMTTAQDPGLPAGQPATTRTMATGRLALAVVALLALAALASIALYWPRTRVPPFSRTGGLVLAAPWLASKELRQAHTRLCDELRELGEHSIRCVDLSLRASPKDLVGSSAEAGASLVAMVESGPLLRLIPVPGVRGEEWLASIRDLAIASPTTRAELARLLHALSWTTANEPSNYPSEIAVPDPLWAGNQVTVLAMFLRYLAGQSDTLPARSSGILAKLTKQCRDAGDFPQTWHCSLAHYLRHALFEPDAPGGQTWLEQVAHSGPKGIALVTALHLAKQRCRDDPTSVLPIVQRMGALYPAPRCERLSLVPVASCLVSKEKQVASWVGELAFPDMERFGHCDDEMRARVVAQRGFWFAGAGKWSQAASDYLLAATWAPDNPNHILDWAECTLQQKPLAAVDRRKVRDRLRGATIPPQYQIQARYLSWLAAWNDADAMAVQGREICRRYRLLPDGATAMQPIESLKTMVCTGSGANARAGCTAYRILTAAKDQNAAHSLRSALACPAAADH